MRDIANLNREHDESLLNKNEIVYEIYRLMENQGGIYSLVPCFTEEGEEIFSTSLDDVKESKEVLEEAKIYQNPLVIVKETQIIVE
jgi:hypothetical protein